MLKCKKRKLQTEEIQVSSLSIWVKSRKFIQNFFLKNTGLQLNLE